MKQHIINKHWVLAKRIQCLLHWRNMLIDDVHTYKTGFRHHTGLQIYKEQLYMKKKTLTSLDTFPSVFNSKLETVLWKEYGDNIKTCFDKYLYYETKNKWSKEDLMEGFVFYVDRSVPTFTINDINVFKQLNQLTLDFVDDVILIVENNLGIEYVTVDMKLCRQTLLECTEAEYLLEI